MSAKDIFTLDNRPNKKKYDCPGPNCNGRRTFTRYIHIETLEDLNESVGKCDRLNNCGYHYPPRQFFEDNKSLINPFLSNKPVKDNTRLFQDKPISLIDKSYLEASMAEFNPGNNRFYKFLTDCFGRYAAENVCRRYHVGNSAHWNNEGANVFWQVDINQNVRAGKVMLYDSLTGKRVKEPENRINWIHNIFKGKDDFKDFHLSQCFFGEHILKYEVDMPVSIVESEKTAIICYLFLPKFIWLATGQANGLNIDKCRCLKGRKITLFPDLKMFDSWYAKAKEIRQNLGLNISVSDTLEKSVMPEDISGGFDLADYLLERDKNGRALHTKTGLTMEEFLFNEYGHWEDSISKTK